MYKKIKLFNGEYSLVDEDDFEHLSKFKWYKSSKGYAIRWNSLRDREKFKSSIITMHRFLCGYPSGLEVDHINRNKLDNRKANLRICTHSENTKNRTVRKDSSSGIRGVYECKRGDKKYGWCANIVVNSKAIHLGTFKTKNEAAEVYKKRSIELFGEFAGANSSR